tara:strand:+ start:803 stop:1372 length:570 start_codon:yes stop_codon:yes gene_type:complete
MGRSKKTVAVEADPTEALDEAILKGMFEAMPKRVSRKVLAEKDLTAGDYILQITGRAVVPKLEPNVPRLGPSYQKFGLRVLEVVDGNEESLQAGDETFSMWSNVPKQLGFFYDHIQALALYALGYDQEKCAGADWAKLLQAGVFDGAIFRGAAARSWTNSKGQVRFNLDVVKVKVDPEELSPEAKRYVM